MSNKSDTNNPNSEYPQLINPFNQTNMEKSKAFHKQLPFSRQYIYSIIVSFGCVCAGTVLAWTSSVLPHITSTATTQLSSPNLNSTNFTEVNQIETFSVNDTEAGLIGSIVAIGAVLGALPAGFLSKRYGIKLLFLIIALLFIIGWTGPMYHSLVTILLGRFIGGVATGAVCVCVPIYISEIASVEIRGILGSFFQVSFCFGILFVNIIGGLVPWGNLAYWMVALPSLYFLLLWTIPAIRLEQEQPLEDLDKITDDSIWKQLNANIRSVSVGLGLVAFQQLSGVNAVIFYTGGIFSAAGSTLSPTISTVIVTGVQLFIAVISAATIEKFSRRTLLLISSTGMALSLSILAVYFFSKPALPGMVPLVSLVLFFFTYCAGYGPLPWLMLGEIFSNEFKSTGCSVATTFNWLLVFGVTSAFPPLCAQLGEGLTFGLFTGFNIAAVLFTWFKVPETRGKTNEQIQRWFLKDSSR